MGAYDGQWIWYYPEGVIHRKEQYKSGKEHGEFTEWSNKNSILNQGSYQKGLKQGAWVEDVNDHREEGSYVDGLRSEEWNYFDENKTLRYSGNFIFGLPDGKHTYYRESGSVWKIEKYEGGVKHGKWRIYSTENIIEQTQEYRQGLLVKVDGQYLQTRKERRILGVLDSK